MAEALFHIVYVSEAAQPFGRQELLVLHARAKDKNRRLALTGLLVHKDDRFVQVLEGEEQAVRTLFAAIAQDPRHRNLALLTEGPIARREFADWSMGFRDLQDSDLLGLYGHDKPLGKSLDIAGFRTHPEACLHLLRFLRDLNLTQP